MLRVHEIYPRESVDGSVINLEFRRTMLAVKFLVKPVSVRSSLILLLKKLRTSYLRDAHFWSDDNAPYILVAFEKFFPFNHVLHKTKIFSLYEHDFKNIIFPIKTLNLSISKTDASIKQHFLANTEKYKDSHTFVYTDASKKGDRVGFGIYIPEINYKYSSRLPSKLCIATAEIVAIKEGVKVILEKRRSIAIIFTDSLSAITKLQKTSLDTSKDYITLLTKNNFGGEQ